MRTPVSVTIAFAVLLLGGKHAPAIEPADPDLIPEAREVLIYLESIYGKRTLIGQDKFWEAERFHDACGKYPAIVSSDLSGWSKTRWGDQYQRTLQRAVDQSKEWWHNQGGIVSFAWHWANPTTTAGTFEATRPKFAEIDVGRIVTSGTKEHEAAMEDLRRHADYLEQLHKARVPVLWRPLHEIEGGWFWWSDTKTPENTAKLWRMMFDYFVRDRKLHNLIWVYSAALKAGDHGKDVEAIEYRKRFYPGAEYVDISGIDIYTNAWFGWKDFREDAFPKAFRIMGEVTPGKMLALCECQGLPNPDLMAKDGPRWLYCLPWYVGKVQKWNPPDWVRKVHAHEVFVTLDRLPKWTRVGASSPKAFEADDLISFVPEMQPMPEKDLPASNQQWSDAEKAKFAEDIHRAAEEWKKHVPEIKRRLTPEKVRLLSGWAKTQMEQYKAVPAMDKVALQPVSTDAKQEKLVLEGTIDNLPSHSPVVTRWLKVYLLYDLRSKSLLHATITIRGEVQE